METSTPLGTAKIISGRFVKECTPPEIFIVGKCVMFLGGLVVSASTGGNTLVVSGSMWKYVRRQIHR